MPTMNSKPAACLSKGGTDALTELLSAIIAIWTQDPVEFSGRYYRIPASKIGPKPVQKPHPPIYQAAHATKALIRAAQLTDGWNAFGPSSWKRAGESIQDS